MEFRLLGPLEVWEDGRPLALGGTKQRALLAILLLRANEVVSRDVLIDELWGERPPASAAHSLEAYVSRLRKTLHADRAGEPILVARPDTCSASGSRSLISTVSSGYSRRDGVRLRLTRQNPPARSSARRSRSGEARRSATSRSSPSHRSRSSGLKSCGSLRSRNGSKRNWPSPKTRRLSPSSRLSSSSIRSASGCADS